MEASIVELRYKMKDILKALSRNEKIKILYHGKEKGVIVPTAGPPPQSVEEHPFFGLQKRASVSNMMKKLRGSRY
jgi:hypothetical protein